MEGVYMSGKVLKVTQYNLEFGATDRFVNVFGCFKYKPTSNLYIIYTDKDTKYNIIYYGSGHLKNKSILSMKCRDIKDAEIIKEYIFKLTNHEPLDNFEMISLDDIEEIEIIDSDKIEVKSEIITSLTEITLPKKDKKEATPVSNKKNKKFKKSLLLLIILMIIGVGSYYYFSTLTPKDTISKQIVCQKEYPHDTLNATVEETNTYNFNHQDSLERVDTTLIYQFNEEDYQDFILKGTYYKYMPDSDTEGGWDKDDTTYTFKVITKKSIDTSYNKPTAYEEVLTYYKAEGYTCTEDIEKE